MLLKKNQPREVIRVDRIEKKSILSTINEYLNTHAVKHVHVSVDIWETIKPKSMIAALIDKQPKYDLASGLDSNEILFEL